MSVESVGKPSTPRPSSAESSLSGSPIGILDSTDTTSSSCSSLPPPPPSVKFAPLPELAPRKRRSVAPLGMAGRGQLMRRRRGYYEPEPVGPKLWTDEELHQYQDDHQVERAEDDMGDPFLLIGRMVKGASKTLWRKVSHKDLSKEGPKTPAVVVAGVRETRPALATIISNSDTSEARGEGKVWEEEIDNTFPLNVGQTETVMEGRPMYSRPKEKAGASTDSWGSDSKEKITLEKT